MNHTIKQYAAILSIALSLASPHAAAGGLVKNFYVTSTIDAKDHVPGDGMCNAIPAQSGLLCTLRAAVMEGNATGELWDVNIHLFPGMTYSLSLPGLDGAAQGDLDIVRNMWIGSHGAGPKAAIDANGMQRVFSISGDGAQIENVEIFGGSSNGVGAAITSDADDVTLNRVDIHGNDGIGACYMSRSEHCIFWIPESTKTPGLRSSFRRVGMPESNVPLWMATMISESR